MTNFPQFGHKRRADFLLADGIDHLNHGGYGATPRVVIAKTREWTDSMEADPTTFFRQDLSSHLRTAAAGVSKMFAGAPDDWAFVENATAGLNAIIASAPLAAGDEVMCLSQVYGGIGNTLDHYCHRRGAHAVKIDVPVPFTDPAPLLEAIGGAITSRTRLAVFDHIASDSGIVFPIKQMAEVCRQHGVPVAIDGAHAPGQIELDVPDLGVDWYVGNLHKWAFAAKGTGVIWCSPRRKSHLHPIAISNFYGQGFTSEFDYGGTRENAAWLSVSAALDYMTTPGPEAIRAHNNALASEAAGMLASAWRTEAASIPAYRAAMAAVRVPNSPSTNLHTMRHKLAAQLYQKHRIVAAVTAMQDSLWVRVSAQIYNQSVDYDRLASVIAAGV